MKNKNIIYSILAFIIITLIYGYFFLPALNFQSYNFLFYFIVLVSILIYINIGIKNGKNFKSTGKDSLKYTAWLIIIVIVLALGALIFSPIFMSSKYAERITVTNSNFTEDIQEVDLNNLPLLDKESTSKVGDRVMGQIPELISQFVVSEQYTQINYNGRLVRTTPLEYNGFIKWFANYSSGTPGYIQVDSTTGEANLVQLDEGMKYMPSAYFFHNLARHLRIQYPTAIFSESKFEIDDQGKPYWVTPVIKYTWVEMLEDVKGVVITDPVTGDSEYYDVDEVPTWVDHVYQSSLVIDQLNDWGEYQDGWFNSFLSQKNVRKTTTGYTYLADSNDIFVYTGITSALADESNIGFVLVNLRTKETKYYSVPGAEEYSAMASAEGAIQEKSYISTFPLLINLDDNPTYLVSLKDSAGLVKAYAFIDVNDYQKVKVTDSDKGLLEAANEYLTMLGTSSVSFTTGSETSGNVTNIKQVVIDGNTYYYLLIDNDDTVYKANIDISDMLPFINLGDLLKFTAREDQITAIISIN